MIKNMTENNFFLDKLILYKTILGSVEKHGGKGRDSTKGTFSRKYVRGGSSNIWSDTIGYLLEGISSCNHH